LSDPAHDRRQRLIGIALMCGALACFAVLDAMAKFLNGYMDTLQVVWARYTGAFILAVAISNPITRPGLMRTGRPLLQVGRSILLLASTLLNFFALRYLQLDQALAIVFSTRSSSPSCPGRCWGNGSDGDGGPRSASASSACSWWRGPASAASTRLR
jgi:hypothetical protein